MAALALSLCAKAQQTAIETTGDIIQIALPSMAFVSTFIWQSNDKPYFQFAKSFALTHIVSQSTKRIVNKERPNGGNYSFPSGHTAAAFQGAAFLQKRYGWEVGIPSYALAGFVGWSRVYANKHDWWDVAAGAALGTCSSYLFTKRYKVGEGSIEALAIPSTNGVSFYFSMVF